MAQAYLAPGGLEGDSWAHPRFHGGPERAILLITLETIEDLMAQGYPLYPGALGENFTTTGLDRRQIRIGDRYRAGQAVIEISRMRVPCSTLDIYNSPERPAIQEVIFDKQVKAGDASSPRWGLAGFYARVVRDGFVHSGDRISRIDAVA